MYMMDNYTIGTYRYCTTFIFVNNSLNQINIKSENVLNYNKKPPAEDDCRAIEDYLIRIYDKAHKIEPNFRGLYFAAWEFPTTSVNFTAGPGIMATVTIMNKSEGKPW